MSYLVGSAGRTTIVTALDATQAQVTFSSTPAKRGSFTIVDSNISASSKVFIDTASGVYTNKGTLTDEAEFQGPITYLAVPGSGGATVYWESPMWQYGKILINYVVL
jgi:hypothetical protein